MEPTKGFFIVADGMGGHAAGEVASAMAVETVRKTLEDARTEIEAFTQSPSDAGRRALVQLLQNAVLSAHQAVYQRGQAEHDKAGMGTTLDVVLVAGPEAFVAHVGDSRTYLIRDGRSSQITTDHTVAEVLVIEGKLTIEEAQVSPLRTILVNAIGVSADVGVEMAHVTLKRGDRLLLCSDGLHDYFPVEEEIAQKLSAEAPGKALADMVELAKTRGGHDNITGITVHVTDVVEANAPAQVDGESTHPVDIQTNPFAADEPTETAFIAPTNVPPRMPPSKATQPMRVVGEVGGADTIPPPGARKKDDRAQAGVETTDEVPALKKSDDAKAALDDTMDAPVDDKQTEAKTDAKPEAKPDAKTDAKPEAKTEAKTDAKPEASAKDAEAPSTEIATADTGRVALPKNNDN